MTAATMTMKSNGSGKLTGLVLLILALAIAIPYMGKASVAAAVRLPEIRTEVDPHANKHPEAQEIRRCLDKNGATQIWRTSDKKYYYALCQLRNGAWGFREFVWNASFSAWFEVTAFVPDGDGSWKSLTDYVGKFARNYKGPFPW
jgi:hypothetical protein